MHERDMTTAKAAELWGVEKITVQMWIRRGKLPGAYKLGRDWIIPAGTQKPEDQRYVETPVRNRRKEK